MTASDDAPANARVIGPIATARDDSIALIGFGAIGQQLARLLAQVGLADSLHFVVHRRARSAVPEAAGLPPHVKFLSGVDELAERGATLAIECAGHDGLRQHVPAVLACGIDVVVASVGALADRQLESALRSAAVRGHSRILIPSGALGGLDVLAAARHVGMDDVHYISRKLPMAWEGTPAEKRVCLQGLQEPVTFFTGDAREAALAFPQNANVAAAVALAGVGFDRTRVSLIADPGVCGNTHQVVARGPFGSIDVTIEGRTLPGNPKTSQLAPLSLLQSVINRRSALAFV